MPKSGRDDSLARCLSRTNRSLTGEVVPYQGRWAAEGADLVDRLRQLVPSATAVDHIGSTAVPGLCAKDCLDAW